jgi:hypothetical protein
LLFASQKITVGKCVGSESMHPETNGLLGIDDCPNPLAGQRAG